MTTTSIPSARRLLLLRRAQGAALPPGHRAATGPPGSISGRRPGAAARNRFAHLKRTYD